MSEPTAEPSASEYLAQYRAVAGHGLQDDTPVVAWLCKGLIGGMNLLEGYLRANRPLPDFYRELLQAECDRLHALLAGQNPDLAKPE